MLSEVRLGDLVFDARFYPRTAVSGYHVGELAEALRAGATLPPVIAEAVTLRVVDGFHRAQALRRVHGPETVVTVDVQQYDSEGELFLACVRANNSHGLKLTSYDRTFAAVRGLEFGVSRDDLAAALAVTPARIEHLFATRTATDHGGAVVPIKRAAEHLAQTRLRPEQAAAIRRSAGKTVEYYASQIIQALDGGIVPLEKPGVREALASLYDRLGEVVGTELRQAA